MFTRRRRQPPIRSPTESLPPQPSSSLASQVDITDSLLADAPTHSVSLAAPLPPLPAAAAAADLYRTPLAAIPAQDYSLLVAPSQCYVWRTTHPDNLYSFPLPPLLQNSLSLFTHTLPLAYLVRRPNRLPGLLLVAPHGHVRYWDALTAANAKHDAFHSLSLYLEPHEHVTLLSSLQADLFLIATSANRIFRLSFSPAPLSLLAAPLTRSRPHWYSLSDGRDPALSIIALDPAPPQKSVPSRELFALTTCSLQRWRIAPAGGEQLLLDSPLAPILSAHLTSSHPNFEHSHISSSLLLLSAAALNPNELVVLVSFTARSTYSSPTSESLYALFQLTFPDNLSPPLVAVSRILDRRASPDPRPLSTPKILLPHGGPSVFILFPDAVLLTSITIDSNFEQSIPLRDSSTNRFIGAALETNLPGGIISAITAVTASSGILSIQLKNSPLLRPSSSSALDPQAENTARLKAQIEQAVFYGDRAQNPLAFNLPAALTGDLDFAAISTSTEIISSSSIHLPKILDLRVHLADRISKLRALIKFIASNGLLGHLSLSARRTLATHAEKLAAAASLWHHQNSLMDSNNNANETILSQAIIQFLESKPSQLPSSSEDFVRVFFRIHVESLQELQVNIQHVTEEHSNSHLPTISRASASLEGDQLLGLIYSAVIRYRRETSQLYDIDPQFCPLEPWTSIPPLLDAIEWHFNVTENLILLSSKEAFNGNINNNDNVDNNNTNIQEDLIQQLTDLGSFLLSMYEERILYEASQGMTTEATARTEHFHAVRSRVVHSLLRVGRPNHALDLAEKHQDFRSLVEICTDSQTGSQSQLHYFMEKYRDAFANVLFRWYIEKGDYFSLLNQNEVYGALLLRFFENFSNEPRISWIHDIALRRFSPASKTLYDTALDSSLLLHEKHIMLSIGKLARVAQFTKSDLEQEQNVRTLELFDDALDIVTTQQRFAVMLQKRLGQVNMQKSIQEQANILCSELGSNLVKKRPMMAQLFTRLLQKCLSRKSLYSEQLIDLLTLTGSSSSSSSNAVDGVSDYCHALEILRRAKDIPPARVIPTLQTIWRRVYMNDDWESLQSLSQVSDQGRADALRQTAVYRTIDGAITGGLSDKMILKPSETFFSSDRQLIIETRFSHLSPAHIEKLIKDYEYENSTVSNAIERLGLDDYYNEVLRLLAEHTNPTLLSTLQQQQVLSSSSLAGGNSSSDDSGGFVEVGKESGMLTEREDQVERGDEEEYDVVEMVE